MGCASSTPEVPHVEDRLLKARTENTETWDPDFRLPQRVSKLDGGTIADSQSSVSLSKYLITYVYRVVQRRLVD